MPDRWPPRLLWTGAPPLLNSFRRQCLLHQPFGYCLCPTSVLPFSVTVRYGRATCQWCRHDCCRSRAQKKTCGRDHRVDSADEGAKSETFNVLNLMFDSIHVYILHSDGRGVWTPECPLWPNEPCPFSVMSPPVTLSEKYPESMCALSAEKSMLLLILLIAIRKLVERMKNYKGETSVTAFVGVSWTHLSRPKRVLTGMSWAYDRFCYCLKFAWHF